MCDEPSEPPEPELPDGLLEEEDEPPELEEPPETELSAAFVAGFVDICAIAAASDFEPSELIFGNHPYLVRQGLLCNQSQEGCHS